MKRLPVLAALFALAACAPSANAPPPPAASVEVALQEPPRPAPPPTADETALLSLVLPTEGAPYFDAARRRAIPFRLPRSSQASAAAPGDFVLSVKAPGQTDGPGVRLPVSLGSPGPRVSPAAPVWAGGGTLLRAPCFGAGTRYELLKPKPSGDAVVASVEVRE